MIDKKFPLFQNGNSAVDLPFFGVIDPILFDNDGPTVLTRPMVEALLCVLNEQHSVKVGDPCDIGIGCDNTGDIIVTEYRVSPEACQTFVRNKTTGECSGYVLNPGTNEKAKLLLQPMDKSSGAAVFLSLIFEHLGELNAEFSALADSIRASMKKDEILEGPLKDLAKKLIDLAVNKSKMEFTESTNITHNKTVYNYEYPRMTETMPEGIRASVGTLNYIGVMVEASKSIDLEDVSLKDVKKVRDKTDYSVEELAKIPSSSPFHVPTEEEIQIKREIIRTHAEGRNEEDKLRFVMIVGPTGTGKTEIVREIAASKEQPLDIFMCSAYTTEQDFDKRIIPSVKSDMAKSAALLSSEEKKAFAYLSDLGKDASQDELGRLLGIPTVGECYFDPDFALNMLGATDGERTHQRAVSLRNDVLLKKMASIRSRIPKEAVSYEVIDSPIVEAVKNGHILEMQELTNIREQGVMSALFDVLDSSSRGTMQTADGVVMRHPDFMCFATANTGYIGNNDISAATLRRFRYVAVLDDLSKHELSSRVRARLGKEKTKGKGELVNKIISVYLAAKTQAMNMYKSPSFEASPQQLFDFADAVIDGVNPIEAFNNYVKSHLAFDREDQDEIWAAVEDKALFKGVSS